MVSAPSYQCNFAYQFPNSFTSLYSHSITLVSASLISCLQQLSNCIHLVPLQCTYFPLCNQSSAFMEANLIMVLYSLKNIQAFPIVLKIMTRIFKVSYKTMHGLPHLLVLCRLLPLANYFDILKVFSNTPFPSHLGVFHMFLWLVWYTNDIRSLLQNLYG